MTSGHVGEISHLITKQRDIASQIEILVVNIGKTNLSNRTLSSRNAKEEILQDLWRQFSDGHGQLSKELPDDHPYLALYELTRATLQQVNRALRNATDRLPYG